MAGVRRGRAYFAGPMLPQSQKIDALVARIEAIDQRLSQPIDRDTLVKLSRERAELEPVHEAIADLRAAEKEREGLTALLDDPEMAALADDEARAARRSGSRSSTETVRKLLIPKDAADEKSAILEIRAGTGGDEAALFAGDLFRMYQRYADLHRWKVEVLSESEGEAGGYKEIIANVTGKGVFARLKFESGRASRAARARRPRRAGASIPRRRPWRCCRRPRRSTSRSRPEDIRIDTMRALERRRPARQHHRFGRPHHPHADRHHRHVRGPLAAPEPGQGDADAARPALRPRSGRRSTPSARPRGKARSAPATARSASAPTTFRKAGSPTTAST